jgi:hypothetical protein
LCQFLGKNIEELRLKSRFLPHTPVTNTERQRAQDDRGYGFGAAKLLAMRADADDIARRTKGHDLAATVRQHSVQAHEALFDTVDVAFPIANKKGVLVRRKMAKVAGFEQIVRAARRGTPNHGREWQRIGSDFGTGKHLSTLLIA